jgi:hypothetical protein
MAHDVFISYSTEDKATADAVCATLEAQQIRCWVAPRDVLPGEDYAEALIRAINESRLLVLVLSSSSNVSAHVPRELERAASRAIPILPLRIEDVSPSPSLEYFIARTHWLDALTPPLEQHLGYLADTIRVLLTRRGAPATATATEKPDAAKLAHAVEAAATGRTPQPTPTRRPYDAVRQWASRPRVRLALGLGGVVAVAIIVLAVLLSGGGDDGSGLAGLVPSPAGEGSTTQPTAPSGTPTTTPSTPTTTPSTPTVAPSTPTATQDTSPAGPAPPMGEAGEYAIAAGPECVAPGGRLEATWTAVEKESYDAIALLPAAARNDEFKNGEWNYVAKAGGREIYPAPSTAGQYEFRLIRGGSHLAVSNSITVQDGCPAGAATAQLEGYSATASPGCVEPGGRVEVSWTATEKESYDAIALFPAAARNDTFKDHEWNYVSTVGGSVIYPAPSSPGEYQVRLIRSGTHLAVSNPITVSNDC